MVDDGNVERHGYTALVVDDDEDTVNLFTEFLEIYDVAVVGKAFDGKQATKIFNDMSPDIIFSDVMMPEYDGFYALEHIKKINPNAIMVMITGDVRADTIHKLEKNKLAVQVQLTKEYLDKSSIFTMHFQNLMTHIP